MIYLGFDAESKKEHEYTPKSKEAHDLLRATTTRYIPTGISAWMDGCRLSRLLSMKLVYKNNSFV